MTRLGHRPSRRQHVLPLAPPSKCYSLAVTRLDAKHEAAGVHRAARRRGGGVAAGRRRAAEEGGCWISWHWLALDTEFIARGVHEAAERTWLGRGPHNGNRD